MYRQLIRLDQENAFLQDNLVQNAVSVLCIFPNQNNYIEPDSTLCVVQKNQHYCVVLNPTQQHSSWVELSVSAQGQAGQVSVFTLHDRCTVTGLCRILHYCWFLYISSSLPLTTIRARSSFYKSCKNLCPIINIHTNLEFVLHSK